MSDVRERLDSAVTEEIGRLFGDILIDVIKRRFGGRAYNFPDHDVRRR